MLDPIKEGPPPLNRPAFITRGNQALGTVNRRNCGMPGRPQLAASLSQGLSSIQPPSIPSTRLPRQFWPPATSSPTLDSDLQRSHHVCSSQLNHGQTEIYISTNPIACRASRPCSSNIRYRYGRATWTGRPPRPQPPLPWAVNSLSPTSLKDDMKYSREAGIEIYETGLRGVFEPHRDELGEWKGTLKATKPHVLTRGWMLTLQIDYTKRSHVPSPSIRSVKD